MARDQADRAKELHALLDDLRSKLVRGDLEESAYLQLKSRAEEELVKLEEEFRREEGEVELRRWRRALGALLLAAGMVLFLAATRVLASGTPVSGLSPESSVLVFLQWLSLAPAAAGALMLLRGPRQEGTPLETRWTFPASPEEARRVLRVVLEKRADRVQERQGWMKCALGRGTGRTLLALYISGSRTRTEVRVEARLGTDTGPGVLREIREEAGALLRAR